MPRYDYKCLNAECQKIFEITHKINEDPSIKCILCESPTKRQISKNVMFETPVDVEWDGNPSDLTEKSFKQYNEAKKVKYKW
jgi:putative FmdB family regulatory protein